MKTFYLGIISFGLIGWPIVFLAAVLFDPHSRHGYMPSGLTVLINWSLGTILAISGTIVADEENASKLRSWGRNLCIMALWTEAACIVGYIFLLARFLKSAAG
jgi:hypothetical protein